MYGITRGGVVLCVSFELNKKLLFGLFICVNHAKQTVFDMMRCVMNLNRFYLGPDFVESRLVLHRSNLLLR